MSEKETVLYKDGRSIDPQKQILILPTIVEILSERFGDFNQETNLSWYDLGMGDLSLTKEIILSLESVNDNIKVKDLLLVDCFNGVFGDVLENIRCMGERGKRNVAISQWEIITRRKYNFDIVNSSNVFHQIGNEASLVKSLMLIAEYLKPNGVFMLTDLHPKYINWLYENYPEKLSGVRCDSCGNVIEANYHFEEGGSNLLVNWNLNKLELIALLSGLKPKSITGLIPNEELIKITGEERYQKMYGQAIPLFYTMVLEKAEGKSIFKYGVVTKILRDSVWINKGFELGNLVPALGNKLLKVGDFILLKQGSYNAKNSKVFRYLSLFVIPKNGKKGSWYIQKSN